VEHDISKPFYLDGDLDGVLHFASPASPVDYLELPIQTLKVGSLGTHHALGIALAKNARFLLASTSEVYGDPLVHPQPETYWGNVNPIGVRGVYDEAKRFAEAMTMAYHRYHDVEALRGDPLTVYGDGGQTRSFCYVSDEIEGIYRLFASDRVLPVNIGNPIEFTIRELADIVLEETDSASKLETLPLPKDDPKVRQPDITLARDLLGWEPQVDLRTGIRRTLPYFREALARHDTKARTI
jgi:dTDP-glucose 4,6-dehydratase